MLDRYRPPPWLPVPVPVADVAAAPTIRDAAGSAAPSPLATTSTRVALTAATAVTDGTRLPTGSQGEGIAVDAAADAVVPAAAAISRRLLSTDLRTFCP